MRTKEGRQDKISELGVWHEQISSWTLVVSVVLALGGAM